MQQILFLAEEILLMLDNHIAVTAIDHSLITVERLSFRGNIQNNLEVFYNCHGSLITNHVTILSNSTTHTIIPLYDIVNPIITNDSFINGADGDAIQDVSTTDPVLYDEDNYDQYISTSDSSLNAVNGVDDQVVSITDQDVNTTDSSINTADGDDDPDDDPSVNLLANHASSTVHVMAFSLALYINLCLVALHMQ